MSPRRALSWILYASVGLLVAVSPIRPADSAQSLAGPRVILVHGAAVAAPIVLSDWEQNTRLLLALSASADASHDYTTNPSLEFALFWARAGTTTSTPAPARRTFCPPTRSSMAPSTSGTSINRPFSSWDQQRTLAAGQPGLSLRTHARFSAPLAFRSNSPPSFRQPPETPG
jgi:hypothetical protein